ncbi:MAG: hypothetical protein QGI83_02820 [Candidatus Latescibacteria bacterium]|jgi:hypothetical protein|nr:hypothetical protein [Candidatus Latescibacterota bacterium]
MRFIAIALICFWVLPAHAFDGASPSPPRRAAPGEPLPQLGADAKPSEQKSPRLAFLMSLVVPGLGELYAGGATKWAVGFLTVESFTWLSHARWRSKGNDLKTDFRRYADANWNEIRYREWQAYNAIHKVFNETETLPCKDTDPNAPSCQKVDTQQYYEMIGKYPQFVFGWKDVQDVPFTMTNDQVDSAYRLDYESQRNQSNKHLKRASVILGLAVVNRIVSAIHASVHTQRRNASPRAEHLWLGLVPFDESGRTHIVVNARF